MWGSSLCLSLVIGADQQGHYKTKSTDVETDFALSGAQAALEVSVSSTTSSLVTRGNLFACLLPPAKAMENIADQKPIFVTSHVEKAKLLMLVAVVLPFLMGTVIVSSMAYDARKGTQFSVELVGFEGLNATLGNMVSPAFNLKVHVENHRFLQPYSWCYNGGEAVVSYSEVAFAWARLPSFCMDRRLPTEFTVLAWGRGVGLSEDLHRRLQSERHTGTAQIMVEMKLLYDDRLSSEHHGPPLHLFKLMLEGDEHPIHP
ncbi:hypothetical protein PR202_gb04996 [Eleusine coracana subsp. coracana]|uniref:Uncharacterized protein n=1 Tax=Eleusine coracana subsp. coracana TaxID=191504 RepID=A0AAV5E6S0_ELECO|nr:hypothetical protein PR202_gb04996 [Eleusine coracana subsp. coracana]